MTFFLKALYLTFLFIYLLVNITEKDKKPSHQCDTQMQNKKIIANYNIRIALICLVKTIKTFLCINKLNNCTCYLNFCLQVYIISLSTKLSIFVLKFVLITANTIYFYIKTGFLHVILLFRLSFLRTFKLYKIQN